VIPGQAIVVNSGVLPARPKLMFGSLLFAELRPEP
jgi:hypothetical protein